MSIRALRYTQYRPIEIDLMFQQFSDLNSTSTSSV